MSQTVELAFVWLHKETDDSPYLPALTHLVFTSSYVMLRLKICMKARGLTLFLHLHPAAKYPGDTNLSNNDRCAIKFS